MNHKLAAEMYRVFVTRGLTIADKGERDVPLDQLRPEIRERWNLFVQDCQTKVGLKLPESPAEPGSPPATQSTT